MAIFYRLRFYLFIIAFGTLFCGCNFSGKQNNSVSQKEQSTFDKILKSGELHVGYIIYPPAVIKNDKTGEISGDFVEIAKYIASELKLKLIFHEATWSTFVPELQTHKYDISIACTFIKVGRSAEVAFSRPIAYLGNSAGIRKGDKRFMDVKDVMDFDKKGITIAVVQGESSHEYVQAHFTNATIRVLSGSDLSAPLTLLSSGQVDVGMTDAYITQTYCKEHQEVSDVFAKSPYDLSPMAWAVRSDDIRLLNFINNSLDFLETAGYLKKWGEKYNAHWTYKNPGWTTW